MISEICIERFRGIKDLKLSNLGRINIIAGANNAGKTSILEVINSLKSPSDFRLWKRARWDNDGIFVRTSDYDSIKALFPMDLEATESCIRFSGINDEKEFSVEMSAEYYDTVVSRPDIDIFNPENRTRRNREYETTAIDVTCRVNGQEAPKSTIYGMSSANMYPWTIQENSIVENVIYISPIQHMQDMFFLDAILKDPELYEQFIDIMRMFDPYFISVNSVGAEGNWERKYVVLSKNHKEGLLLNAYGDGMKKAMLLLSAAVRAKNGILLLDEYETAIHISAMEKVFRWLMEAAEKLNVQIFMTSHSLEAIETVLKCCPSLQKEIRMITLVKVNDELKVRNVNGEKAIQLLDEYGLELR